MEKRIEIVYYKEVVDNFGRCESSMKGDYIFSALNNVDEWSDDMVFEDDKGQCYSIDDLQGKLVLVKDIGIFEVPKEK